MRTNKTRSLAVAPLLLLTTAFAFGTAEAASEPAAPRAVRRLGAAISSGSIRSPGTLPARPQVTAVAAPQPPAIGRKASFLQVPTPPRLKRQQAEALRLVDQAEAAVRSAAFEAQSARRTQDGARQALANAGARVLSAGARQRQLALQRDEAKRAATAATADVKRAKVNLRWVRMFRGKIFGWAAERMVGAAEEEALAEVRAAKAAEAQAQDGVTALTAAVDGADADLRAAREAEREAQREVEVAVQRARTSSALVVDAERLAGTARQTVSQVDAAIDATRDRRAQVATRLDQHRLRVIAGGKEAAQRLRRSAKAVELVSFIEPKPGERSQDALAAAPEQGLFAIADGVSQSDFPGELARALVSAFTHQPPAGLDDVNGWMRGVQANWAETTRPIIADLSRASFNRNRRWDAYSTFVGARLRHQDGKAKLDLFALGDSVAFLVRGGKLVPGRTFPLAASSQFSNVVHAIPFQGAPTQPIEHVSWTVQPGDEVFLATDALAAWIFSEVEAGRDPFTVLRAMRSHRQMTQFVARARDGVLSNHGPMNEDDTSFLRFVVPQEPVAELQKGSRP